MRIAQLAHALDQDQVGGLERYVAELSAAQVARGHEVTVITKRLAPELPAREMLPTGVRLIRVRFPERSARSYALRYPVESLLRTAAHIRPRDYDVVHAHFPFQGLAARARRSGYVYTFHAPVWAEVMTNRADRYAWPRFLEGAGTAAVRAIERAAVNGASERVVLSRYTQDRLRELAPGRRPATIIDGGIDTDFFAPDAQGEADDARTPLLLCAGRLTPMKGVQNLVEAMPEIVAAHPTTRLVVAGGGAMLDPLRRRAGALGLTAHIDFRGPLDSRVLREAYRAATLCINPSLHHEGFGLATAEALACGTPVLGTPVGATPELLAPLDPALVARDSSAAGLAEAVRNLLDTPERVRALGPAARAHAVARWSWPSVVSRYEDVYARVLSHPPPWPTVRSRRPAG